MESYDVGAPAGGGMGSGPIAAIAAPAQERVSLFPTTRPLDVH
jgi:hypothetical protein